MESPQPSDLEIFIGIVGPLAGISGALFLLYLAAKFW